MWTQPRPFWTPRLLFSPEQRESVLKNVSQTPFSPCVNPSSDFLPCSPNCHGPTVACEALEVCPLPLFPPWPPPASHTSPRPTPVGTLASSLCLQRQACLPLHCCGSGYGESRVAFISWLLYYLLLLQEVKHLVPVHFKLKRRICIMLWSECVLPSPPFIYLNLNSQVTVSGDGAFGPYSDHKGSALMDCKWD